MLFQKELNQNPVVIKGYQPGQIEISGQQYHQPIMIDAQSVHEMNFKQFKELDFSNIESIIQPDTEVLIVGTGETHQLASPKEMAMLSQRGIAIEIMSTRMACHTFQVLVHERRKVQALLFP